MHGDCEVNAMILCSPDFVIGSWANRAFWDAQDN